MGVLACDRNGCDNIMCDRHSQEHGYICYECFEELVSSGPTTDIESFMQSRRKPEAKDEAMARYNVVFESS